MIILNQIDNIITITCVFIIDILHRGKFFEKYACNFFFSRLYYKHSLIWERSSVWLERMPVTHEVASSSLVVPAIFKISTFGCFFNGRMILARSALSEFGGFTDEWSEQSEQIRIANRLSLLLRSNFGETL